MTAACISPPEVYHATIDILPKANMILIMENRLHGEDGLFVLAGLGSRRPPLRTGYVILYALVMSVCQCVSDRLRLVVLVFCSLPLPAPTPPPLANYSRLSPPPSPSHF